VYESRLEIFEEQLRPERPHIYAQEREKNHALSLRPRSCERRLSAGQAHVTNLIAIAL